MEEITTNERFDRLTNLDISTYYRDREYWLMKNNFLGAFAYWVVAQSPYDTPGINPALGAFNKYISVQVGNVHPVKFTYDELSAFINEDIFESIPEIEALNHPKIDNGQRYVFVDRYSTPEADYDFIDLGALARNIFYMLLREQITQSDMSKSL